MSTARGVALIRAMENRQPAGRRLFEDRLADAFVHPSWVWFNKLVIDFGLSRLLGVEPFVNFTAARERFVTDLMRKALADRVEQVVVLGAGFDTRSYALTEAAGIPVFEVDHPVTQREKLASMSRALPPANVQFVPVDFDRDDLAERLRASGYTSRRRCLFVWQGVVGYLTPDGIDNTLQFVASDSSPGSWLCFDYPYLGEVYGRSSVLAAMQQMLGEPTRFGIPRNGIDSFLTTRGFTSIVNADAEDLHRLYPIETSERPMTSSLAIVTARVPAAA